MLRVGHLESLASASNRPAQSLYQILTSLYPQYMGAGHKVQLGDNCFMRWPFLGERLYPVNIVENDVDLKKQGLQSIYCPSLVNPLQYNTAVL